MPSFPESLDDFRYGQTPKFKMVEALGVKDRTKVVLGLGAGIEVNTVTK